ncbi:TPA: hypothetical protein DCE37_10920 [Candidatus Latescibacteria bacterium]|nr:hypothetical protein [Candidatus Latescibacterota bacterium]
MSESIRLQPFLVGTDGEAPEPVVFEASDFDDPALSPDGRTIALSSNRIRFWSLHLLHLETLGLSVLTTAEETDLYPIFSPGGAGGLHPKGRGAETWTGTSSTSTELA